MRYTFPTVGTVIAYKKLIEKTVRTKGQYFSECNDELPPGEWQRQIWGNQTYTKLLEVKKKYDPENHFTCKQCVGSNAYHLQGSLVILIITAFVQVFA